MAEDAEAGNEGQQSEEKGSEDGADERNDGHGYGELPEEVRTMLRAKDNEAAKYRKQLRQAESKLSEYEQANLSEAEKQQQYVKDLEAKLQQAEDRAQTAAVQADITATATSLGFKNPKVAHRLVDSGQVEFDDKGQPTNVDELLKEVLRDNPYLANSGSADGGKGRKQDEPADMNTFIRQATGRK